MWVATSGVERQANLFQCSLDAFFYFSFATNFEWFSQRSPQSIIGMQRGIGILKHHLHIAAEIALKTHSWFDGVPKQ
ncbi:Uncharacterised protein [Klebsiella pneumoniae]|nr:Uncharacterised protein [Klebsiella pneumoniae]